MERLNPPRLTVDLSEEQSNRLTRVLPWGNKKAVFHTLIDELILLLESVDPGSRQIAIGAIVAKKISVIDILREGEKKRAKKVKKNETP